MMKQSVAAVIVAAIAGVAAATSAMAGKATLNLVLVVDGLRPDSITAQERPISGGCARRG